MISTVSLKVESFLSNGTVIITTMQVHGGMGVIGVDWCDFVVWTEAKGVFKNIFVKRIKFDHSFWRNGMLPKLESFYTSTVVPEILTHKLLNLIA